VKRMYLRRHWEVVVVSGGGRGWKWWWLVQLVKEDWLEEVM